MPSITTLSGGVIAIDLSSRDFESFRDDILKSGGLADTYASRWNDRSEVDLGVALVEAMSFIGDNLAYYQERCTNEALFESAVQRRSVIEHAALLNFQIRPNVSAQVALTIVTNDTGTLPAGAVISTSNDDTSEPQSFELAEDFESTAAGTYTNVYAYHGTTVTEIIGSSSGAPSQRFQLSRTPLALNPLGTSSLEIWVYESGTPVLYTQVEDWIDSGPTDNHYIVEIGEDDIVTIEFGDGVDGKRPPNGTNNVEATYRVGGGEIGNSVGPNTLTELSGNYTFVDSITNPDRPSGGLDKASIEEIKYMAPRSFRAQRRAVSHDDYADLSRNVPGVRIAYAHRGVGRYEEIVVIAAGGFNPIPTGEWDPHSELGSGLLGAVGTYLNTRHATPVILTLESAQPVDLHLGFTAHLFKNTRKKDAIRNITKAVLDEFNINKRTFNAQVPLSMVSDVVEDVMGVDYIDLHRMQRQPYAVALNTSSIYPADLVFSNYTVTPDTENDLWTLVFSTSTSFTVTSRNRGLQSAIGTVGVPWVSDLGTLGFTITVATGGNPPTDVDRWSIKTGAYRANVDPEGPELVRLMDGKFIMSISGGVDN